MVCHRKVGTYSSMFEVQNIINKKYYAIEIIDINEYQTFN